MSPNAQQIRALFVALVRLPPERCEAFLKEACDDEVVRQQVRDLLQAHHQPDDSFLDTPLVQLPPTRDSDRAEALLAARISEAPGTAIGPYTLRERIGEGGMGEVWMAEQHEPMLRSVALKIIKAGMDTRQVVARFEAERQALALMDHPNIARVFDGGTTETGRPYFVMELVKGVPITRYCNEHRLTLRERLELFVPVCQAIQHAHQKGIIHRDIKPANVLIAPYDGRPVPKIIDFGVAKAIGQRLTDLTLYTGFGAIVGTLEYMSPEQAELNNQDIDTRSDVYALGVLLYELLTGSTPLNHERLTQAAFVEMLRAVREEEPPKPSTRLSESKETLASIAAQRQIEPARLTKLVHGELDWIVMKALEKDRTRRYDTASGLARDVERYLADEPVQACPPSTWYRFGKLMRRNKAAIAIASLIAALAVLLAGGGGWLVGDRAARRHEAEGKVLEALKAVEPRLELGLPRDPALMSAVQRVEAQLDSRLLGPAVRRRGEQLVRDARMLTALDEIRQQRALTTGGVTWDTAGTVSRYAAAFSAYGIDVATLEPSAAAAQVRDSAIREALLAGLDDWMQVNAFTSERARLQAVADGADGSAWRRAFRTAALAGDRARLKTLAGQEEALALPPSVIFWLAAVLSGTGLDQEAESIARQGQIRHPEDFWLNHMVGYLLNLGPAPQRHDEAARFFLACVALRPDSAEAWSSLGLALARNGENAGAISCYQRAIALDPKYAVARVNLAGALQQNGQRDEAIALLRKAIPLAHVLSEAQRDLNLRLAEAYDHGFLGDLHRENGQLAEAIEAWRLGARLMEEVIAESDGKMGSRMDLLRWQESQACALLDAGRSQEGEARLRGALSTLEQLAVAVQTKADCIRLNDVAYALGAKLERMGRPSEAVEAQRKTVAGWEKMVAAYPFVADYHGQYGWSCHRLANLLELAGRHDEAQSLCRQVRLEWDKMMELAPNLIGFHVVVAWNWVTCPAPNCRDIPRATEILQHWVKERPNKGDTWNALGAAYYRGGEWNDACSALARSMALRQGGDAFDWFFLAMSRWQVGKKDEAERWYALAQRWTDEHMPVPGVRFGDDQYRYEDLLRIQSEAAVLLGLPEPRASSAKPGQTDRLEAANLLLAVDPSAAPALENRGHAYAELGQWDRATADFARLVDLEPDRAQVSYFHALAQLGAGDTQGYRSRCARMLEAFGKTEDPNNGYWAAWTCALAPDAVAEPDPLVSLAERVVAGDQGRDRSLTALGAALYRAGRYGDTVQQLNDAAVAQRKKTGPDVSSTASIGLFLAMAHHRIGHTDESRKWLADAVKWMDQSTPTNGNAPAATGSTPWNRRLTLELLRREAKALIEGAEKNTSSSDTIGNSETTTVTPQQPAR